MFDLAASTTVYVVSYSPAEVIADGFQIFLMSAALVAFYFRRFKS